MMYVVFEKWACERIKWSALIAIGDAINKGGVDVVEYFTPPYFSPESGDMPKTPEAAIQGIFTWGFNYFKIQEYYKQKHIDVFVTDNGFLGRDQGYQYILKNNTFVKNRKDDRFKALGLEIKSSYSSKGPILVVLQNHHKEWYDKIIEVLRAKADRPIKIREWGSKKPLEKDLFRASALVTYNSTALYTALLHQIPVFCSKDCPVSNSEKALESRMVNINFALINDVGKVEDPLPFLSNVAYNQYTLEEMREGIWAKELL